MHLAAVSGKVEIVKALLDAGADASAVTEGKYDGMRDTRPPLVGDQMFGSERRCLHMTGHFEPFDLHRAQVTMPS